MSRERIVNLNYDEAIEKIKGEKIVMLRVGIWNKYTLTSSEKAIQRIRGSGYGADIYVDDDDDIYYVSIPTSSDMW